MGSVIEFQIVQPVKSKILGSIR